MFYRLPHPIVWLKRLKSYIRFLPTLSFCGVCGRKVHDFSAPDDVWEKVEPNIKYGSIVGHVLCYDCFCEMCVALGLPPVWRLEEL